VGQVVEAADVEEEVRGVSDVIAGERGDVDVDEGGG
jgi:hypothetical protein